MIIVNLKKKIHFLTLNVFSKTGGIEKVCSIIGKVLNDTLSEMGNDVKIYSLHDEKNDAIGNEYFPIDNFSCYNGNKIRFVISVIKESKNIDTLILSHVNLLFIGWTIKLFNPKINIILLAHGIEVWERLNYFKRKILGSLNTILCVSTFTSNKIIESNNIKASKVVILNNCLNPFINNIIDEGHIKSLQHKYQIGELDKIIITVCRVSLKDRSKGYHKVIQSLIKVKKVYPSVKYFIIGTYENAERDSILHLAESIGLKENVHVVGFVEQNLIASYYSIADVFIMPSIKEGFGNVFIESMYYNVPVIGGNLDGSVDALYNGKLGTLVNPNNSLEIADAILDILNNTEDKKPNQHLLQETFSYNQYKNQLVNIICQ